MAAEQYAAHSPDGIERLGDVEAPGGRRCRTHGEDVGVGRSLKNGASSGHYVDGEKEETIRGRLSGGIEEQRAGRVKRQTEHYAGFIAVATDKNSRRKSETEIGAVEGKLHQRGLEVGHRHDAPECRQKRIVHIVGQAPQQKQERHQRERHTECNGIAFTMICNGISHGVNITCKVRAFSGKISAVAGNSVALQCENIQNR